ncbi:MAG: hypothetical protein HC886_14780 [Leptolyngbyaceae cyanobacterium SM1_1_3]|nr:hypothetical protein [Leptolyngbyaceae cyanobacterium SM1_1_3]
MPLIAGGLSICLAYRCQSKVIFGLGAILVSASFWTILLQFASDIPLWLTICLTVVPYALLWAYRDRLWPILELPDELCFQPVARRLAILAWAVFIIQALSTSSGQNQSAQIIPLLTGQS